MTKETGYTTKPIELPLSTEKEYVLIDVSGYLSSEGAEVTNEKIVEKSKVSEPFYLTMVGAMGDGYMDGFNVIDRDCETEFFHEVIRSTDLKTETPEEKEALDGIANGSELPDCDEWHNGDGCVFNGIDAVFIGYSISHPSRCAIEYVKDCRSIIDTVFIDSISKPETPEQKAEREVISELCSLIESDDYVNSLNVSLECSVAIRATIDLIAKTGYRKNA